MQDACFVVTRISIHDSSAVLGSCQESPRFGDKVLAMRANGEIVSDSSQAGILQLRRYEYQ